MNGAEAQGMMRPAIIIPFLLTGAIWGSTWYVITGQIDGHGAAAPDGTAG